MSTQTFHLPDVGEGLTEAEIVAWKVAPGDTVAINDVICEIETAKSLVELPSPFSGTVGELLAPEGDTVTVGSAIITISGGEAGAVNAALSIMVGGDDADFESASDVFAAVGKTIVHVGPSGAGQTVKAANQLIVAGNIGLLAEAVVRYF